MQIVYASTSGNVEFVVETVADLLVEAGISCTLHRAEQTSIDVIKNNGTFILATSTWEHGEINPFFDKLLAEMKTTDMTGKRAAFIGLGDMRYEPVLFNQGIKLLKSLYLEKGGKDISDLLLIDGEPYNQIDDRIRPWTAKLIEELKNESQ